MAIYHGRKQKKQPRQTKEKGIRTCSMAVPILLSSDNISRQLGNRPLGTCHSNKCMFDWSVLIRSWIFFCFLCCSCNKSKSIHQNPIIQTAYLKVNMLDMFPRLPKKVTSPYPHGLINFSQCLPTYLASRGSNKHLQTQNTLTRIFPYHPCMVYLPVFTVFCGKCRHTIHGWDGFWTRNFHPFKKDGCFTILLKNSSVKIQPRYRA